MIMRFVVIVALVLCYFADLQQVQAKNSKGNWLCRKHSHCKGGCCKGFICIKYLKEGELCLIEHKWNVGCGCAAPMKCKQDWMLWRCVHDKEEENGQQPQPPPPPQQQQQQQQQQRKQASEKKEIKMIDEKEEVSSLDKTTGSEIMADILMEGANERKRDGMADKIDMGMEYDDHDDRENDFFIDEGVEKKKIREDKDLRLIKDKKESENSKVKELKEREFEARFDNEHHLRAEHDQKAELEEEMQIKAYKDYSNENQGVGEVEKLNADKSMKDVGDFETQRGVGDINWWYPTGRRDDENHVDDATD